MQRKNKRNNIARGSTPGRLRIVAGKWRSRLLPVADVEGLRPTAERIRETLFNWLSGTIEGSRCLDLYAGTGALGIEALSRGAGSVTFVDNSGRAVDTLRDALKALRAENATIEEADALTFLSSMPAQPFDVIFLDPPFASGNYAALCSLIAEHGWVDKGSRIYLEQDKKERGPDLPGGWELQKEKTAGNVRYSLFETA